MFQDIIGWTPSSYHIYCSQSQEMVLKPQSHSGISSPFLIVSAMWDIVLDRVEHCSVFSERECG